RSRRHTQHRYIAFFGGTHPKHIELTARFLLTRRIRTFPNNVSEALSARLDRYRAHVRAHSQRTSRLQCATLCFYPGIAVARHLRLRPARQCHCQQHRHDSDSPGHALTGFTVQVHNSSNPALHTFRFHKPTVALFVASAFAVTNVRRLTSVHPTSDLRLP